MSKLFSRSFCALLCSASALLTGCANMATTAPSGDPFGAAASIQGHVHGGNQPIAFASIQLYAAGNTGYGSAGTLYATTTSADDGAGSWGFSKQANTDTMYAPTGNTWACPATGNPYMYLIARGGNTQGTHDSGVNNSAAVSFIGMGPCSGITASSFYDMNEVTTVASLAALQQYFNPNTDGIGAPSTTQAQTGLKNAFTTIPLLASFLNGTAQTTTVGPYFTAVAEAPKVNTIANIMASCVNNPTVSNTQCTTLFGNAVPPAASLTSQPSNTFKAPTDVLQAAYFMLVNPSNGSTSRLSALFGLSSAAAPFQPSITNTPQDWTVGVTFYSTPGLLDCNTTGVAYFHSESVVVTDASGHAVITNNGGGWPSWTGVTPSGQIYGGLTNCTASAQSSQSTIDPSGNVFLATNSSLIYDSALGKSPILFNTPVVPSAIASDGFGNIFYTSTTNNSVYEIGAATIAAATAGPSQPSTTSTLVASNLGGNPQYIVADPTGNLWVGSNAGGLYELYKSGSSYITSVVPGTGSAYGVNVAQLAVEASGSIVFPYANSQNVGLVGRVSGSPTGYSFTNISGTFYQNGIAVDGAGKIWAADEGSYNFYGVNSGFVAVISSTGSSAIPPYGIVKPATSGEFSSTLVQNETVMGTSPSIAIDLSGNVWTTNSFTNMFSTANGQQYCVTEIVGAGVPVVAPFSTALATGTIATKP